MVKRVICVIPARLHSVRFPKKLLAKIKGKPLIQWVYERASTCSMFDEVHVAIDDPALAEALTPYNTPWTMTDTQCTSGTARLLDFRKRTTLSADVWVNWQGDEPLICGNELQALIEGMLTTEHPLLVGTLKQPLAEESLQDPSTVKVVSDATGRAQLFTRTPHKGAFAHVGLYAFTAATCDCIEALPPSKQALYQALEQLQFLEQGIPIQTYTVSGPCIGVDTQADFLSVQRYLLDKV